MSNNWVTRAFSNNATPVEYNDEVLEEEGVVLLAGKNTYGEQIYSYLKLTIRNLTALKEALRQGTQFIPSDFGTVLAAGRGEPDAEVKSEMAATYKLIDVPARNYTASSGAVQKPKLGSFTHNE